MRTCEFFCLKYKSIRSKIPLKNEHYKKDDDFFKLKEDECKKFISKKDYLILSKNSKDDIWLGKGMYFWDNRGNANWWNQKQSRRKPDEVYSITVVNADLCELLDLTDFDIYMKLEELWEAACKKMKKNSNVPLGNKLNFSLIHLVLKQGML